MIRICKRWTASIQQSARPGSLTRPVVWLPQGLSLYKVRPELPSCLPQPWAPTSTEDLPLRWLLMLLHILILPL